MPVLELLVSPPGTGKSTTCIELFRERILKTQSGIESRSFFVLPSREHAERIRNLVLKGETRGLFNAHILTINDLTMRFLGFSSADAPNDAARRHALDRVFGGRDAEGKLFKYFAAVAGSKGFRRLILDSVKEFSQSLLDVKEFERLCQPLLKDPAFRLKFRDFTLLLKRYHAELEAMGFREPQDGITELLGRKADPPKADLVLFDGFYHFTRAQRALLRAVAGWSDHCVVTLTLPADPERREGLFEYPERTRAFLLESGFREKRGSLTANHRVRDRMLLHLEKNLFLKKPSETAEAPSSVEVFEASDMRNEIELVAREIKRLYRERELHYSDICVALRSIGPYERVIEAVFEEFGVPVFIHERKKLIESGLVQTVYRLLNLTSEDWKREDLFYFLRSSYLRGMVAEEDFSELEALSFGGNIRQGRQAWIDAVRESAPARRALETALMWEGQFLGSGNAAEFGRAVEELFTAFGLLEGFRFKGEDRAEEEVWKTIRNILKAMRDFADARDPNVRPAERVREFQESLEAGLFSLKPPGKNRVQVYDVVMALPKEYKVVFLSGLLERSFPLAATEDPLFKDSERRKINREGLVLEERAWRLAGERYFFYMGVTRAKEKLYLTYPLYDAEGRPALASFFVEEVRKIFPALLPVTKRLGDFVPPPKEWVTEAEAVRGLAFDLFKPEPPSVYPELLREWSGEAFFREIADWGITADRAAIQSAAARRVFNYEKTVFSPTRLETFATCAFKHFSDQILKLKEPLDGREFLDKGNVLHQALEEFYKELPEQERADRDFWSDAGPARELLFKKLDEVMEKEESFRHEPLYRRKAYRESMRRTLNLYLERESALMEGREFTPAYFEWAFGLEGKPGLRVAGSAGEIQVRGRIDRIDVDATGKKAVVMDYKLSKRSMSIQERLKKGIELQLPLYFLAVEKLLGLKVEGAELRLLQTAKEERLYPDSKGAWQAMLDEAEARVRNYVARMREADIAVRSKNCEHCSFSPVCRFETWRLVYEEGVS